MVKNCRSAVARLGSTSTFTHFPVEGLVAVDLNATGRSLFLGLRGLRDVFLLGAEASWLPIERWPHPRLGPFAGCFERQTAEDGSGHGMTSVIGASFNRH